MIEQLPFSLIDALLALVVLLGALTGWRRGFVIASLDLVVLLAGVALAFLFHQALGGWLAAHFPAMAVWSPPLGFLGILIASWAVLGSFTLALARIAPPRVHVHAVNRFLGILPGLGN